MPSTATEIWIAGNDGHDMIRADAIVLLRLDMTGRLTAQLRDDAKVTVTLLDGGGTGHPPGDFHRRLLQTVAELADSSGARLVRPERDDKGWRWLSEPL
ncbi:hypothetical protein ACGFNU_23620 [Spirillospora sp. NPDC048911]|uniref:hypothetical protein n=1 Tax=Spirillospora sp. NPDC048911 TaxID=3364527 RepID=UPI0037112362